MYLGKSFLPLLIVFVALCTPLVLSTKVYNHSADEGAFYQPAILQIRQHWPMLDMQRDCLSATTPLYPYTLAGISLLIGTDIVGFRIITCAVSLALLFLLWRHFPKDRDAKDLLWLGPLAFSNFFVKSASWTVTDNPALVGICVALALIFFGKAPLCYASAVLAIMLAVLTRQTSVWLVVPLGVAVLQRHRRFSAELVFHLLLVAAPIILIGFLVIIWGGLVPPLWQNTVRADLYSAGSVVCYALAVLAIFGGFFLWDSRPQAARTDRKLWHPFAIGGFGVGLMLWAFSPTIESHEAGRWGGYLWSLTRWVPSVGDRSLLFLILTPLGGAITCNLVVQLWQRCGRGPTVLWGTAVAAWLAVCCGNRIVFHRYYEPITLLFLIFWILFLRRDPKEQAGASRMPWGMAILSVGQLIITLITAHRPVL